MMEIKSVAKSFFMSLLPQAINEALDWDTLKIDESARRNANEENTRTDITYVCNLKKEGIPIFLHAEQERSDSVIKIIERDYRYNAGLLSRHRKQGNKKMPVIINFLLHNNPKISTKSYPKHSFECSEVPWLEKLLHGECCFLLNVKQTPDEILARYGPSGIMDLLIKRAEERNFSEWLKSNGHLIKNIALEDTTWDDVFDLSLSYVVRVAVDKSQGLLDTFEALFPQYEEKIMTVARQLERKGEKVGEIKGKKVGEIVGEHKKAIEVAQNLHKLNLDIDMIQQATGLTKGELKEILQ